MTKGKTETEKDNATNDDGGEGRVPTTIRRIRVKRGTIGPKLAIKVVPKHKEDDDG